MSTEAKTRKTPVKAAGMESDQLSGKAFDVRLVRRMLHYVRPYSRLFAVSLVLVVVVVILQLLTVELVKRVIDGPLADAVAGRESSADAWGRVVSYSIGIALLYVGNAVLQVLEVRWINRVAQSAMRDLRVEVFAHVQRQALRFFDRNPLGRLVTRVVSDVEALSDLLTSGLDALFKNLFLLAGIVVWLLVVNWELALVTFAIVPPLVVLTQLFRGWSRRAFRKVREGVASVNSHLQESIQGVRVIQAFVQEDKVERRFHERNQRLRDAHVSTVQNFAFFFPVMELVSVSGKALVLWYGGRLIVGDELTLGVLTQFVFYLELFVRPIREVSERFNTLQGSMASAERLFKLLDRDVELESPANPFVPEKLRGEIRFDQVGFSYVEDQPVLTDIDFHVRQGESVALVGATGAGKTTVASLLTRLYDIDDGAVKVDDVDVREWDLHALRRAITVVPQDVFLFAGTVEENLRMGDQEVTREQLLEACSAVGADRLLARLPQGLDSSVGERGGNLSVGERQLLALARALVQDPAVLVLDEATSSVDSETEHLIQQALDRLQVGRTSLIVAHRLSTIRKCDRILVFHKGRLREQGTHRELLAADGIYATLHRLQFAGEAA